MLGKDHSLRNTASWVICNKATGESIMETFNPDVAAKVNTAKYEAVPILDYLHSLNKKG